MIRLDRRQFATTALLSGSLFSSLAEASVATALTGNPYADDIVLGDRRTPMAIVEYLSPTSRHCAKWHRDVFPKVKTELVDSGRVKFVIREVATRPLETAYLTFILARKAVFRGKPIQDRTYLSFIEAVFAAQEAVDWDESKKPDLRLISERFGIVGSDFDSAIGNWDAIQDAVTRTSVATYGSGVTGAPTIFVGEEELSTTDMSFDAISTALGRAKGAR